MKVSTWFENWISFKTMITPILLNVLYQTCFFVVNFVGLILTIGVPLITILGGFTGNNSQRNPGGSIVSAVIFFVIGVVLLIIINIILRVYFELMVLLFNIYKELKTIDRNTKKPSSY